MISPEFFYEDNLKGKTAEQIMTTIRGLKQEIGRLKNIAENPYHEITKCPTESTQIHCLQLYLERAKFAFVEAGGEYILSVAEQKAIDFENNIPYINKVEFSIGGYFDGYETRTYTIDGDKIQTHIEHSLFGKQPNSGDDEMEPLDKDEFLEKLDNLRIGEWRRRYDSDILDGTQWELEIYFSSSHKPVKICGSNAYPYNFDCALELFGIEKYMKGL